MSLMMSGYYPYTCILPEGYARVLDRQASTTPEKIGPPPFSPPPTLPEPPATPLTSATAGAGALPPLTSGGCSGWGGKMPPMPGQSMPRPVPIGR